MKLKLLLFGLILSSLNVLAQQRTITGKVSDADGGDAIPGVNIAVKGGGGTITDSDGTYSLSVSGPDDELTFSFVGFASQTIKVGTLTVIDVLLAADVSTLEEVVVSGLATNVKRSNLANSVGTISAKDLLGTTTPITTDGAMQGKLAGANIMSNGSIPGGGFNMQLRGVSTLGSSASQPLFIVDGIYIDNGQYGNGRSAANKAAAGSSASPQDNNANRLADLNPDDIENIEVLKGASAAAIYGTRANAGVVIITTKKGKAGKTQINFGQDVGFSKALSYFGGADWTAEKINDWFNPDDVALLNAAKSNGTYTDWEKVVFGETGKIRNTRLSIKGGDQKTTFFINGSLSDETGIVKNTGFTRASLRTNITHKVTRWLDIGVNSNLIRSDNDRGWSGNDNSYINYGYSLPYTKPYVNLYPDAQGNYPNNVGVGENPLAIRDRAVNNQKVTRTLQAFNANAWIFSKDMSSLVLKFNSGVDYQNGYATIWLPSDLQSQKAEPNPGFAQDTRTEVTNYNIQLSAVYTLNAMEGKLGLTTSAGLVQLGNRVNLNYVRGVGLPVGVSNPARAAVFSPSSEIQKNTDQGFFFQEEANFDDKVVASVGVRFDRSTLNSDHEKWYAFPRGSLATNIHRLVDMGSIFSQLKVRVAYGQTAGLPTFGSLYSQLGVVAVGGLSGFSPSTVLGNTSIGPERAAELEYGLDFGLLNNRITAEFTLYNKKVTDLIQPLTTAPTTGVTSTSVNAADLTNKGMELTLSGDVLRSNLITWNVQPIFWFNRSKITRLDIPERLTGGFGATFGQWRVKEGFSPTQIVGQPRTLPATDPNYLSSWTVYGDQQPKYEFSINQRITFLKNFEFSALLNYRHKFTVVSLTRVLWDEGGNTSDWNSTSYGRDSGGDIPTDPADVVPNGIARQNVNGVDDSGNTIDGYNPEIASFLKLREIALYYKVPTTTLQNAFGNVVQGVKIGFSGNNILRWTDYEGGYDPENSNFGSSALGSGVDLGSIPSIRRFMFHLSIDF
jgi:TonB-linked SusC/RagA family outer membrane protein